MEEDNRNLTARHQDGEEKGRHHRQPLGKECEVGLAHVKRGSFIVGVVQRTSVSCRSLSEFETPRLYLWISRNYTIVEMVQSKKERKRLHSWPALEERGQNAGLAASRAPSSMRNNPQVYRR